MIDMESHKKRVEEAVAFLRPRLGRPVGIGLVLGTGLSGLAEAVETEWVLPYGAIPHFPRATVASHGGNLLRGRLQGREVLVLQGRFHYYEGYSTLELTLPVRVLALLGVEILLLTNAAGGLNPALEPGAILVIQDHLNFIGENPLRGPNVDEWGPRFPDLSQPYDPLLIAAVRQAAVRLGLPPVAGGVYVAIPGPSLETPAETRYLRNCGADAVGMSTVPEVIVARHAGMRVLALSLIANVNNPDNLAPIRLDEIISRVRTAAPALQRLIMEVLAGM